MVKMGRTITWIRGIKAALEGRDRDTIPPTPCLVDNNGVLSMLKDITIKTANRHIFRSLAENRERVNLDKIVVPCKRGHQGQPGQRHDKTGASCLRERSATAPNRGAVHAVILSRPAYSSAEHQSGGRVGIHSYA